jgi:hypothetical protein
MQNGWNFRPSGVFTDNADLRWWIGDGVVVGRRVSLSFIYGVLQLYLGERGVSNLVI